MRGERQENQDQSSSRIDLEIVILEDGSVMIPAEMVAAPELAALLGDYSASVLAKTKQETKFISGSRMCG